MNFENWIPIIYKPKTNTKKKKKKKKGFGSFRFTMETLPPIKLKQSQSNATSQTLTAVLSSSTSHDTVHLLVRETLRIKCQSRFFTFDFDWAAALSGWFAGESEFESVEAGASGGRVCEFELEADLLQGNRWSQMELHGWKRCAFWNLQEELHSCPHFLKHFTLFCWDFFWIFRENIWVLLFGC